MCVRVCVGFSGLHPPLLAHLNAFFVARSLINPNVAAGYSCTPQPSVHTLTHTFKPLLSTITTVAVIMRAGVRVLLLVLAAGVCVSHAQNNNSNDNKQPAAVQQQQPRSIWDDPIRFNTKAKDACTMVVSGAGDYTRLRVSCKGPSQGQSQGRSYYCDFQGKPNLCRAYNTNPRHYFTQMMWDMRKQNHACQGPKVFRPLMCKKYPEEAHMTFLAAWPKTTTPKPAKPVVERKPVTSQTKPVATKEPLRSSSLRVNLAR